MKHIFPDNVLQLLFSCVDLCSLQSESLMADTLEQQMSTVCTSETLTKSWHW